MAKQGITDVSINADECEIFGFIGPNDAGKSTMIRTLLNLFPDVWGSKIFGKNCVSDLPSIAVLNASISIGRIKKHKLAIYIVE